MNARFIASLAALLVGCASPHEYRRDGTPEALLQADRDFASETARRGIEGWVDWFATDGVQADPKAGLVVGHDEIRSFMGPAFADPTYRLEWEPLAAHVSPRGDLGVTWGRYTSKRRGPEGVVTTQGRYVTVWRRGADGRWRIVYDTGTPE